jgi:hypothetical protein
LEGPRRNRKPQVTDSRPPGHEGASDDAELVLVALGELTFAGGDPQSWDTDAEGTRWYDDELV